MYRICLPLLVASFLCSAQALGVTQEECLKKVELAKEFMKLRDGMAPSERQKELDELSKAEALCQNGQVEEGDKLVTSITTKDVYKGADHLGQTN